MILDMKSSFLAVTLVLFATPSVRPADVPRLADLTPEVRQRLDRQARQRPPEPPAEKAVSVAGDFTAWLISRSPLTPEEERDRAREMSKALLADIRTVPTPAVAERIFRRLLRWLAVLPQTRGVYLHPDRAGRAGRGCLHHRRRFCFRDPPPARRPASRRTRRGRPRLHPRSPAGPHRPGTHPPGMANGRNRGGDPERRASPHREGIAAGGMGTAARRTGRVVEFLYTWNQQQEADLLAFHLCRNTAIPLDGALDALRWLAVREQQGAARAAPVAALARLRILLMERDGEVDDPEKYGLFAYNPRDDSLAKAPARSVAAGDRPIVLVHGMHGKENSFREWLPFLAGQKELAGRRLLLFRYPNNESLALCSHFLHREMSRVVVAPAEATFIAHGAGGLVVRWYAEVLEGRLDRAVLLATPNAGSNLAALRVLLDLSELVGKKEETFAPSWPRW